MPTITPETGPVAVTGASGYIGSWIVQDCVEQGYQVHACVRDKSKPEKVDHLLAMNDAGHLGRAELFEADIFEEGSYDEPFAGCAGVIHAAAPQGYNDEPPQATYDGCFTQMTHIMDSVLKAETVQRFVYTSSFAAVTHPCEEGYVFTEKDWASDNVEGYRGAWTKENIPKHRGIGYKMAKESTEKMIYRMAEKDGSFEALSIMPGYVIGPVMCKNHDQRESFQYWMKRMLSGDQFGKVPGGRMQWNKADVRDIGKAHRLCLESPMAGNGSRYIIAARDDSEILFTWELQAKLKALFPSIPEIGGEEMVDGKPVHPTGDTQRAYCTLAEKELGLKPYSLDETLIATAESYVRIGLLPATGE